MDSYRFWVVRLVCMVVLWNVVHTCCASENVGRMSPNEAFSDPQTAGLVVALENDRMWAADSAIRDGANVNSIGKDGITPLLYITTIDLRHYTLRHIQYLLEHGADPNLQTHGMVSALSVAAQGDNPAFLEMLLKHNGNPNLIGPANNPLLHFAVLGLKRQNVDILLKYGADINQTTAGAVGKQTAAELAVQLGQCDMAVHLLESGLTPTAQLASVAQHRWLPPNGEQQNWKEKLLAMLKDKGIESKAPWNNVGPNGKENLYREIIGHDRLKFLNSDEDESKSLGRVDIHFNQIIDAAISTNDLNREASLS